jgi:hypothetical protein
MHGASAVSDTSQLCAEIVRTFRRRDPRATALRLVKAWEESKHARDHGKFASKPGARGKAKGKPGGKSPARAGGPHHAFDLALLLGGVAVAAGAGYAFGRWGTDGRPGGSDGGGGGVQPESPHPTGPPLTRAERVRQEAASIVAGRGPRAGGWRGTARHRTTTFDAGGQTFTFHDKETPDVGLGVPSRSFIFEDDAGSHDRTGRVGVAGASDVFRQATATAVGAIAKDRPPMVVFTAGDPRRASLYKLLVRSAVRAVPGYSALAYDVTRGDDTITQFLVVQDEHRAKVSAFLAMHGVEVRDAAAKPVRAAQQEGGEVQKAFGHALAGVVMKAWRPFRYSPRKAKRLRAVRAFVGGALIGPHRGTVMAARAGLYASLAVGAAGVAKHALKLGAAHATRLSTPGAGGTFGQRKAFDPEEGEGLSLDEQRWLVSEVRRLKAMRGG